MWKIYGWRSPENKWYVGSTSCKTVMDRAGHDGYRYVKKCPIFGEAIKKYGWYSMEQNILRLCLTKEEADYWERYYIKEKNSLYPNGYNLQDGGQSAHAHEYSRQKMSMSQTGRKHTPEELEKISYGNKGKRVSDHTKHLISIANGKRIQQFSLDGQLICEYSSIKEAALHIGHTPEQLYASLKSIRNGKSKTAYNSLWRIE